MWREVDDKVTWNDAVSVQPNARFLQSWEWGEFQESLGRAVKRLSWNDEVLVQAIKMPLPLSNHYWYIPHGPLLSKSAPGWQDELKETLNDGALFVRVDPVNDFVIKGARIMRATQPQCTRILDLSQSEDALKNRMRQKTRYNIRLAEKRGVNISTGSISDFLRLNAETKTRDKFASHPDEYYQNMVASLPKDFIKIYQASYQNTIIASNIIILYGDTATYTHGASSNEHRETMAPYLLHWRIIQELKKQGIRHYDLWGINPADESHRAYKKSWQGISRFKEGFGGAAACYPNSFDVIYNSWLYTMYTFLRKFR
ncbi:MAG: peptidoglycan bridge formation glycyltransferase FemA/FemB family protein [Parcubacteria group bacterium]|nr:peptidoglycan bridge formation glycyltransferase FemA/FemB family protein [Parcubacteria group bacterium]